MTRKCKNEKVLKDFELFKNFVMLHPALPKEIYTYPELNFHRNKHNHSEIYSLSFRQLGNVDLNLSTCVPIFAQPSDEVLSVLHKNMTNSTTNTGRYGYYDSQFNCAGKFMSHLSESARFNHMNKLLVFGPGDYCDRLELEDCIIVELPTDWSNQQCQGTEIDGVNYYPIRHNARLQVYTVYKDNIVKVNRVDAGVKILIVLNLHPVSEVPENLKLGIRLVVEHMKSIGVKRFGFFDCTEQVINLFKPYCWSRSMLRLKRLGSDWFKKEVVDSNLLLVGDRDDECKTEIKIPDNNYKRYSEISYNILRPELLLGDVLVLTMQSEGTKWEGTKWEGTKWEGTRGTQGENIQDDSMKGVERNLILFELL